MKPVEQRGDDAEDRPSTGFLPITLALSLFVAGLFVLGIVPGVSCGHAASGPAQPR